MDIDHPVRNSTNYTVIGSDASEEVSDHENTEPSSNINKQRFADRSTAEIGEITTKAEKKNNNEGRKEKYQR